MMKNYYQLLGLDIDASIADVEEKYQILIKEFDPSIHEDDLKDYFKLELEKVQDAYSKILLNHKKEGLDTFLNEDREPISLPKTISDSYKLLKLKEDATLGEITNGYKILIEEFNPDYQSEELKEFFKKEQEKVTNSYKKIIIYLSTLNVEKENDTSEENDSINNKDTEDSDNINISEEIDFEAIEDSNSESVKVKLKESDEILVLTKEEWFNVVNNNEAHLYEVLYDLEDSITQSETNNSSYNKSGIKKYFSFDNEPITGWTFFWRNILGAFGLIAFILPGLWIWAANGYKRAGTFNWSNNMRVISSIAIIIAQISNFLAQDPSYYQTELNLFDIIAIPCSVLVFILLVKNGNKHLHNNNI